MKFPFLIFFFCCLTIKPQLGLAGGAVAKQRQLQNQRQQIRVHQQLIQQKAIQKRIYQEHLLKGPQPQQETPQEQTLKTKPKPKPIEYHSKVLQSAANPQPTRLAYHQPQYQIQDEVDIRQLWESFKTNSQYWPLIINGEAKAMTVEYYIDYFSKQGIAIRKSPPHYVQLIDSMTQENPSMLNNSFQQILFVIAVMEYDFDNGQNKDALALKILGNAAYQNNKKRLGIP